MSIGELVWAPIGELLTALAFIAVGGEWLRELLPMTATPTAVLMVGCIVALLLYQIRRVGTLRGLPCSTTARHMHAFI